ncbi:hypothetical protein [Actinoplanes sp. NPDC049802]|uniref:hypothetical protein n=1 Tax=Actinoplanes sp. NPDC049802 TaxID=3154742 RepID=UPI0033E96409
MYSHHGRKFLARWYAEVCRRPGTGSEGLRDRIAWALGAGRLSPRSFGSALDRALSKAFKHAGGRQVTDLEIVCVEPQLLPVEWLDLHGATNDVTSSWENPDRWWPEEDFDLVEISITYSDFDHADVGRAYAAPDGLDAAQAGWYDILRMDGRTPAQAAARARLRTPGRLWRLSRRRRTPYRRRAALRYPLPHPALVAWLREVRAQEHPDQPLLDQLIWATGRLGCLTEVAYTEAAHRAERAARRAGSHPALLTIASARTDLLARHAAGRTTIWTTVGDREPSAIDRVVAYGASPERTTGSSYARPVGLRDQQAEAYERHRNAGVGMADAYHRSIGRLGKGPTASSLRDRSR